MGQFSMEISCATGSVLSENQHQKDHSMQTTVHDALIDSLSRHFPLRNSRLETLAVLIVGLVQSRTVNLSHLASQFPAQAKHGSNYRRLQRLCALLRPQAYQGMVHRRRTCSVELSRFVAHAGWSDAQGQCWKMAALRR
jgi:hypothetical protein